MKLPRGYRIVDEQVIDGSYVYTIRLSRWRFVQLTVKGLWILARGRA